MTGFVNVFLASVSVLPRPTNVSVAAGSVIVPEADSAAGVVAPVVEPVSTSEPGTLPAAPRCARELRRRRSTASQMTRLRAEALREGWNRPVKSGRPAAKAVPATVGERQREGHCGCGKVDGLDCSIRPFLSLSTSAGVAS
jgi:hypothetical protein